MAEIAKYPENYSSTEIYENILNLDTIPILYQGNVNNFPIYFNIQGMPEVFSYGKHYFNLIISNFENQDYNFKPNSKILFEFKSSNGVVIRSGVDATINQRNGVIRGFVEILEDPRTSRKDIADGIGTLCIVGILDGENIPQNFKNKFNYKCVFPIDIRKNITNADSPKIINTKHELRTINGAFSFVKNSVAPRGDESFTYDGNTGAPLTPGIPGGGAITD